MGKSKQTTTTKTNMSINKLTLAALATAYANGVQISSQSKDVFSDIGNWFENDFVDFWTDDFAGAFEDLGDWFAGDFADWWTEDFADFWTEDFAGAFEDAGDWLAGDFADWRTNDFVNFWEEDFVDFWEYTVPEVILGAPSKEEQEEMEEKKKEYEEKKKEIEDMKGTNMSVLFFTLSLESEMLHQSLQKAAIKSTACTSAMVWTRWELATNASTTTSRKKE